MELSSSIADILQVHFFVAENLLSVRSSVAAVCRSTNVCKEEWVDCAHTDTCYGKVQYMRTATQVKWVHHKSQAVLLAPLRIQALAPRTVEL